MGVSFRIFESTSKPRVSYLPLIADLRHVLPHSQVLVAPQIHIEIAPTPTVLPYAYDIWSVCDVNSIITQTLQTLVAGTPEERGMQSIWESEFVMLRCEQRSREYAEVYSLSLFVARIFRNCRYLEYPSRRKFPEDPASQWIPAWSSRRLGRPVLPMFASSSPPG
jgi:hypothetical protein